MEKHKSKRETSMSDRKAKQNPNVESSQLIEAITIGNEDKTQQQENSMGSRTIIETKGGCK